MKGLIDKDGKLNILRGKELKEQWCNRSGQRAGECCDTCPLFGEPEITTDGKVNLTICDGKTLIFEEFFDDRLETEKDDSIQPSDTVGDCAPKKRKTYKSRVGVIFEGNRTERIYPTSDDLFMAITGRKRKNLHVQSEDYCSYLNANRLPGEKRKIAKIIRYKNDGTAVEFV